ncbi:MAG: exodeoxyribonuclease VII large subunit [Phycisphaerales bacterium]|nr:exodeoxyribonuclease VII large subunit [Phycisphaerales bacterium]
MNRPRFDPSRMAPQAPLPDASLFGAPSTNSPPPAAATSPEPAANPAASTPPASPSTPPPITVAQLSALIDATLRDHLPQSVRVVGEVSNFTLRTHWYFSLKEGQVGGAVINCVMFAGRTRSVGFQPAEGQQVVVTGRVEYYKPQGKVSFYVEKIEPVGAGVLELALRQLIAELKAQGYLDPDRKRPLPSFPRRVAIITSRSGAALQDVLNTMKRRCPAVQPLLIDVLVQGKQAAPDVARAITWAGLNHERLNIDALLVTRGGGSIEDLWAFNERIVAEAIYRCPIPVVAAIGHETDTTVAELVADERCATPTQAAMRLTPDREELAEQLSQLSARLSTAAKRRTRQESESLASDRRHLLPILRARLDADARKLAVIVTRLERCKPTAILHQRSMELQALRGRAELALRSALNQLDLDVASRSLSEVFARALAAKRDDLTIARRQLELVGPNSVLSRGYSMTVDQLGQVVRRVSDVRPGQQITTRVADGSFASVVGESANLPPAKLKVAGTVGPPPSPTPETAPYSASAAPVQDSEISPPSNSVPRPIAQANPTRKKSSRSASNTPQQSFTPGPDDLEGQLGLF